MLGRKPFLYGFAVGALSGVLICLTLLRALHNSNFAKRDGWETATEWNSFSAQERIAYTEGYLGGYRFGSLDACGNADKLFEIKDKAYMEDGTPSNPVMLCVDSLDTFTKIGKQGKLPANYSQYSDTIPDFYRRYPKYKNAPFPFLIRLMSDRNNFSTSEQLFQKLERNDMQVTF